MIYLAVIALLLYLSIAYRQLRRTRKQESGAGFYFLPLTIVAMLMHGYLAWRGIAGHELGGLGLAQLLVPVSWVVNLLFLLSLAVKPAYNVAIVLLPLSGLAMLLGAAIAL